MAELVRCKSCGYVMPANRVGARCPACGVDRKMMEPWKDPVSERRRIRLGFDLHPIVDHFSVSFATCAFALVLFELVLPDLFRQTVTSTARAFIGALPVAILGSYLTGLLDGTTRFRRTTTPLLVRKQVLAVAFFVLALGTAALTFFVGPYIQWVRAVDVVLLAGCVVLATVLGLIGKSLNTAIFPGCLIERRGPRDRRAVAIRRRRARLAGGRCSTWNVTCGNVSPR